MLASRATIRPLDGLRHRSSWGWPRRGAGLPRIGVQLSVIAPRRPGLTGWALGWVGYNTQTATDGLAQTDAVNNGIYMLANLVPGVGYVLVAVCLIFLYPLKKKVVDGNNAILSERRAAGAEQA